MNENVMTDARTPRSADDRSTEKRPSDAWVPPSNLPEPDPRQGWRHRWIRVSNHNAIDNSNISRKLREGWEPVQATEYPEVKTVPDRNSQFKGCIEVGGLLLCRLPEEKYQQRRAYYDNLADRQIEAVDNDMFREEDSRMPFLKPERDSRSTFGRGGS